MNTQMERQHARELTFARDNYTCILCRKSAFQTKLDAHHLIERRLWQDGGYHVDNLVSLCEECHQQAEEGLYSPHDLRQIANIGTVLVPDDMYDDVNYDKWGNVILDDHKMIITRGPLMDEKLELFLREVGWTIKQHVKYPRTYHLPWSNANRDDRTLGNMRHLDGKRVILTEKWDGENTTMYNDHIHARSVDGKSHPSQGWVRNLHGKIAHNIPDGMRICGENLYARHSIKYDNLTSYFYVFSIWDGMTCLSWDDTKEWCDLLGLTPVNVFMDITYSPEVENAIKSIRLDHENMEGYVIRLYDSFEYKDFSKSVAKYVRPDHVQTHERWETKWTKNELAS